MFLSIRWLEPLREGCRAQCNSLRPPRIRVTFRGTAHLAQGALQVLPGKLDSGDVTHSYPHNPEEHGLLSPAFPGAAPLRTPSQSTLGTSDDQQRTSLTLISFGFKYGPPPANHYFDVSFLKNPARQQGWNLWSQPSIEMRDWVLKQNEAVEFLDAIVPMARFLAKADDGARIALGCSAGRHRSTILTEELARRLRAEGLEINVLHRERNIV